MSELALGQKSTIDRFSSPTARLVRALAPGRPLIPDREPDAAVSVLVLREAAAALPEVWAGWHPADIRRVAEVFEHGKRKALIVMATGTGKTRVAMSLVELFLRSNWARRILFVADRDALVDQALTEGFQAHIPDEPSTRIYSHHLDTANRLYVVTLQTLSNCFQQFTPAFFDLIIFDEVHRSIFNKWNEVLTYFDARMIGLTATPAGFIDRNTFNEFDCFDGAPTFLYGLEEAIKEGYLVDFDL